MDFIETIAACDLKVGGCRQLIELMKICEYSRSMSFFTFAQGHLHKKLKLAFRRNHLAILNQILYVSF